MIKKFKGSILIALSAVFFASYGIWSRLMMHSFGEFNQAWIRALLLLLVLIPFGLITKKFREIAKIDRKWFVVISLSGGINQAPFFYGFEHLPVGTATLLFYTMLTVGAYIIGKFFFQEKITMIKYLSLLIAIVGLFMIYSFSLNVNQILSAIASIIAGLMGASVVVFSKKLSSGYSETQILTSMFTVMFGVNFIISLLLGENFPVLDNMTPVWGELGYTAAMLIANAAVVMGFKYLEPSIGALIGLLEVIFAISFGIIFFQELLTMEMILGIGLVLIAIALPDLKNVMKIKNTRSINN